MPVSASVCGAKHCLGQRQGSDRVQKRLMKCARACDCDGRHPGKLYAARRRPYKLTARDAHQRVVGCEYIPGNAEGVSGNSWFG